MNLIAQFFAGAFLCNCVPHLVAGLQGSPFPTPFAKPFGVGLSSPLLNFAWGMFNFIFGVLLLSNWPMHIGLNASFAVFLLGATALGIRLSVRFGRVRRSGPN